MLPNVPKPTMLSNLLFVAQCSKLDPLRKHRHFSSFESNLIEYPSFQLIRYI